uniref:Putative monooxygenase p33MONOX n=1 Tax=Sus scrofa TaxID=9823 RepID=A0A8D1TN91_PIG
MTRPPEALSGCRLVPQPEFTPCSVPGAFGVATGTVPFTPWLASRLPHFLSRNVGPWNIFSVGARAAGSSAAAAEQVEEGDASASSPAVPLPPATDSADKVPVVKAKATHVIMSSLITKQTQESIQRFEQQAGLRDAGYTPHKGLTTEETNYLRVAEALHKLKLQSGEITREEKQPASTQSTPSSSPHSSPKQKSRGWFTSGSSIALPGPNLSAMDSGSGDKDRSSADKWGLFAPRSLQKSDSGSFATQVYRGAQKPSPMELIRVQATRMAEDPATFQPPKMDIPVIEGKKQLPRTHNLKSLDLNVLTPTGF